MPIDFPSNPLSGQTYSYAGQQWQYNGVAWDKLIIADDALALKGVSGERFVENLVTGLLYGGLLSINSGNSATFDITSGAGIIVTLNGSTTGYPAATVLNVSWAGQTGITTPYLASSEDTFISINSSGNLVLQDNKWTDPQGQSEIIIGTLFHSGTAYIDLAINTPNIAYGHVQQVEPFIRAFGPLKLEGYGLSGATSGFYINKDAGKAFMLGRNYENDPDNSSVVSDGSAYPVQYYYMFYRNGSGGFSTTIRTTGTDVANYDDGTGTLNSVPGGKYTVQRLFGLADQPELIGIYYGRQIYNSIVEAEANIPFENFSEAEATLVQGIFLGYLVVKGNASNLTNPADSKFIAAGLFRNTSIAGGGGGGGASTLASLTDVSLTGVVADEILVYDGAFWTNRGLTGQIGNYVTTVVGLTGAVGITNGSGIGLSVSGNTLTVSNTGVLSIDGSTGAITNVARKNIDNNFSASQTINAFGAVFGIYDTLNSAGVTIDPLSNDIIWTNGLNQSTLDFNPQGQVVTLPNITTTLAGLSGTQTFGGTKTFNALTNFNAGISSAGGTFSALTRFTAGISASGATFSGNISAPNIVNSVRGLTGAVGITNGSGIGLSVSGNTLTVSNTGVMSVNGSTGAITNVARTNVDNNFSASQTIEASGAILSVVDSGSSTSFELEPGVGISVSDSVNSPQTLKFNQDTLPSTVTLPNFTTTLAGLSGTQTFGGTKTFNALTTFNAGISSAGGTFSALTRFTAGISAAGGMTLSDRLTIQNNIAFGITASSPILEIIGSAGSGYNGKRFSYFSSASIISNTPICSITTNGSGRFKITIVNIEQAPGTDIGYNISTFIVSNLNAAVNWTENLLFNGASRPSYDMSYSFPSLTIFATQSTAKFGSLLYRIEIEQL
jgi:hypothetical protein